MPEQTSRLDRLVRAATVALGADDGTHWGSGGLVAPGWVLTAAHVVRAAGGESYTVTMPDGSRVPALTGYRPVGVPDHGPVPAHCDLALVRLLADGLDHDCVWMTDRGDPPSGAVRAYGWYQGGPGLLDWTGNCEVAGGDGLASFRLGPQSEIPKGVSGGPVVDLAQGAVVGVTKARRSGEGGIRDGGRAVRTSLLREFSDPEPVDPEEVLGSDPYHALIRDHDLWHAESDLREGWPDLQGALPGNGIPDSPVSWSPGDRVELLELFAVLPPPDDPGLVRALLAETFYQRVSFSAVAGPRHWRDGHGEIHPYRMRFQVEALPYLRFARLVALAAGEETAGRDLARWVRRRKRRLGLEIAASIDGVALPRVEVVAAGLGNVPTPAPHAPAASHGAPGDGPGAVAADGAGCVATAVPRPAAPARPGDGPSVLLELEPVLWRYPLAFYWRLRVLGQRSEDDALVDAEESGDGVGPDELPLRLQRPLARVFLQLDTADRFAPLEVALPADHFDLAVQRWLPQAAVSELGSSDPASWPLGVRRQVFVRDSSRRGPPDPVWAQRWIGTAGAPALQALHTPAPGGVLRRAALADAEPGQVPVVCTPAGAELGREAMEMALGSGHGIVLWRAQGHPATGCDTTCHEFREEVAGLLAGMGSAADLPEQLRVLRERVHRREPRTGWAEPLALVYDDASRPLPALNSPLDSP
ncbi:trypsin-like peptidase domain-containing protein [Streptomyces sp. PKU-EA00015]|uniref:VMAP-C domain-containing protein n=1 Tax=Streptomyces sp. PKU-EA00015 TaxID=2748326 RepID=UPI0015A2E24B|nr:trypsin-like peptidase domain-containing protein [Streptomyces sp. PKU-EA00015]NWF30494.1 trypsin-like peptidase domain-containing protein [Streptomyces sp. PKU-EA00015]